jgi:hypothetical protein
MAPTTQPELVAEEVQGTAGSTGVIARFERRMRLRAAFAEAASLVSIAQFNGFVYASGGAAWHCGAEHAVLGGEVHLDGGVAAAVQDFARFD